MQVRSNDAKYKVKKILETCLCLNSDEFWELRKKSDTRAESFCPRTIAFGKIVKK